MDLRVFIEPQQGASYDQQLAMARAAEEAGFGAFFRSDHVMAFSGDGLPGPTDSWVTLGALARETSTIRLGTMVTSMTFRFPGMLAISVAQVDDMSGGRVELGLGAGWFDGEHAACAIPFPPLGERMDRLEEQFTILRDMWATPVGERYNFQGRYYSIVDSPGLPKPAQRPHPPFIVGGAGASRTPALAATFADEFNLPFHPIGVAGSSYDRVRQACERVGRDPGSLVYSTALTVCCGADSREIDRRAGRIGRPPEQIDLAGTPAQIVDTLGEWGKAGASRVYLQTLDLDDLDHIRLIAAEVMPHV
jgi:F420-dependent oxidoreductase-like protein